MWTRPLIVSLAAHAAALALAWDREAPPAKPVPPEPAPPIEIVVLDEPPAPEPVPVPVPEIARADGVGGGGGRRASPAGERGGEVSGPSVMAMRTPGSSTSTSTSTSASTGTGSGARVDLRYWGGVGNAPVAPVAVGRDDVLAPSGGGTYEYEVPGVSATVARDGTVTFEDRSPVGVDFRLPCVTCVGRDLAEWAEDPSAGHGVDLTALIPFDLRFELTDLVMGWAGDDPYAYKKAQFLERTFDQRASMAEDARRERQMIALRDLPKLLAAIHAEPTWSRAKKRQVLDELLEECDDTPEGRAAAATIRAFLDRHY